MLTEQEKYYERKNREAKEWDELGKSIGFLAIILLPLCLLWWAWPVILPCAILWLIYWVVKQLLNAIGSIYDDIIDYCKSTFIYKMFGKLFAKINIDLQKVLDFIGITILLSCLVYIILNHIPKL